MDERFTRLSTRDGLLAHGGLLTHEVSAHEVSAHGFSAHGFSAHDERSEVNP